MAIEDNPLFQGKRAKEIWETLKAVDVSKHIEKKGYMNYLSWAWAWGTLMDHYPQAEFSFRDWDGNPACIHPDGSASVECTVSIGDVSRTMWLPVMDNRNHSVMNPDSRAISDCRMRCLTKCIALFGLGHYIYAGEDLPTAKEEKKEKNVSPKKNRKSNETPKDTPVVDGVVNSYEVFMQDCKSEKDLTLYYRENEKELDKLKETEFPTYEKILNTFSAKRKELLASNQEGN